MSKKKKEAPLVTPPVPPDEKIESTVPEANRELTVSTPDEGKPHQEPEHGIETATVSPAAETATTGRAARPKYLQVEVLRSHPSVAMFAGDKGEISQEVFDRVNKAGDFLRKL